MGVNIDIHIYDAPRLLGALRAWGADKDALMRRILESCGTFFGDSYVLLNNELWDGYSPYYNVSELFDAAFGGEDSFDVFLDVGNKYSREGVNSVDVSDAAENLGIELPEGEESE